MILFHQFLAKWKKEKRKNTTSKIPFSSEDCKTLPSLECVNRAIVTEGTFWLSRWSILGPLCCLLLFVWVWPTSSVQGVKGRLGCIKSRGVDCPLGISCMGCRTYTCAEGQHNLGTRQPRRHRAQGREEIGGRAAMRVTIGGIPDKASQIRTPLHWSLHFSGSGYPLLCSEKSQLYGHLCSCHLKIRRLMRPFQCPNE